MITEVLNIKGVYVRVEEPTTPLGALAFNGTLSADPKEPDGPSIGCLFAGVFITLIGGPQAASGVVGSEIVSVRGPAWNRPIIPTVGGLQFDFQGETSLLWFLDGNGGMPGPVPMEESDKIKIDWANPDGLDYGWGIFYYPGNSQVTT